MENRIGRKTEVQEVKIVDIIKSFSSNAWLNFFYECLNRNISTWRFFNILFLVPSLDWKLEWLKIQNLQLVMRIIDIPSLLSESNRLGFLNQSLFVCYWWTNQKHFRSIKLHPCRRKNRSATTPLVCKDLLISKLKIYWAYHFVGATGG